MNERHSDRTDRDVLRTQAMPPRTTSSANGEPHLAHSRGRSAVTVLRPRLEASELFR